MKKPLLSLMLLFCSLAMQAITTPNAHGGGFLWHKGRYYWYGEHKSNHTSAALVGITCYSSANLKDWRYEGIVLPVTEQPGSDIERGCIMERPKVIYNAATRKFVMWFHLELKGRGYSAARAAVAVANKPTGPFTFLRSGRVNAGRWPALLDTARAMALRPESYKTWWTPEWHRAITHGLFVRRDLAEGQMSRDMTLYVDDDGTAYHIYSSEDNLTLHIAELTADYTSHTGRYWRMAPGGQNEAPTLFKKDGTYWMITSGCTGWAPNAARMFSAPSLAGPWTAHDNPCRGPGAETTFGAQGTYALRIQGTQDFVFVADVWQPKHPSTGYYLWIPITFEDGKPTLRRENIREMRRELSFE